MPLIDARVPVRLIPLQNEETAFLIEGQHFHAEAKGHPAGCTCCTARNSAGRALASLLQDRARGRVAFFRSVTAVTRTELGLALVLEALESDPVASACFRLEEGKQSFFEKKDQKTFDSAVARTPGKSRPEALKQRT